MRIRGRSTLTVRRTGIALVVYAGLLGLTYLGFNSVPGGFIPDQDKQYLIAVAQLPPAAALNRTDEVTRRIGEIGLKQPGIVNAVQFTGMSVNGFTPSSSATIVSSRSMISTSGRRRSFRRKPLPRS